MICVAMSFVGVFFIGVRYILEMITFDRFVLSSCTNLGNTIVFLSDLFILFILIESTATENAYQKINK